MDREKVVHIQNRLVLSHKNWNDAIWSNMDGLRAYLTNWNKLYREGKIPNDTAYMWNLSFTQMKISMKEKQTHGNREQTYGLQEGGSLGREN